MSTNDFNPRGPENFQADAEDGSGVVYSELPERVAADVRRVFGGDEKPEVPAWVGLALIAEFQSQHKLRRGRARAIRFATVAAALAIAVTAGMHYGGFKLTPGPAPTTLDSLARQTGGVENKALARRDADRSGRPAGSEPAPGATLVVPAMESSRSLAYKSGGDSAVNGPAPELLMARRAVTLDLDHNGRTDILDALILAKSILDPTFYKGFDAAFDLDTQKSEEPVGILLAKAESSWDLTKDGKVDDNDLEALVAEIVKIGGA